MRYEFSAEALLSLASLRLDKPVTIVRGPGCGLSGRALQIGRDGNLRIRLPLDNLTVTFTGDGPPPTIVWVSVDCDWLDTNFVPSMMRPAYLLRRGIIFAPENSLRLWSCLLPERVRTEDLGDYVERINADQAKGRYGHTFLLALAAVFFTAHNASFSLIRKLVGNRRGSRG